MERINCFEENEKYSMRSAYDYDYDLWIIPWDSGNISSGAY